MFVVAQVLEFGQSEIWTYRTKQDTWHVYRPEMVKTFSETEAQRLIDKYPRRKIVVIPLTEAIA